MNFEKELSKQIETVLTNLFGSDILNTAISIQKTRKEFEGDFTLVVFPYAKIAKKSPDDTANLIGEALLQSSPLVESFNSIKGFLNISLKVNYWIDFLNQTKPNYGIQEVNENSPSIMIEYPSPNTNKPLHLGHLRNIFLGASLANVLKANGNKVVHTCLYNDRGTNISKSMLVYEMADEKRTPDSSGLKGDKLVGDYYVQFSKMYKAELDALIASGLSKEDAEKQSKLMQQVNDMTVAWENGDEQVRALWKTMNGWVYKGFDETYKELGISPSKFYYESDVYNLGKETVEDGLAKGIFYKKDDGSVWIDLTADGLDNKIVLRSNGTTVYITQDIAVANEKEKDFKIDKSIYVVGNEQEYHFKVLFLILKKLGRTYADNLYHLSYGMVELPEGKMKTREGTVVEADDLIHEMYETAEATTRELGKLDDFESIEAKKLYKQIGLGALKYFILKVDAKKKILFNPKESVDFNGHTGPFIQYTHARIKSILRKAKEGNITITESKANSLHAKERELMQHIYHFDAIVKEAGAEHNPAVVANYVYDLAKLFNQFYQECPVMKPDVPADVKNIRLQLCSLTASVISNAMGLLAIEVPERM